MIGLGMLAKPLGIIPLDQTTYKGLVWLVGTKWNTEAFTNPHTAGRVTCSWIGDGTGTPASTVNRAASENVHTSSTANSWWKIDIDPGNTGRRLAASHMTCQNRATYSDQTPTNAVVQGSNNNTDWTTLRTVAPGTFNAAANTWTTLACDQSLGAFRYFQFKFTTTNASSAWYICIQEYELFGTLTGL